MFWSLMLSKFSLYFYLLELKHYEGSELHLRSISAVYFSILFLSKTRNLHHFYACLSNLYFQKEWANFYKEHRYLFQTKQAVKADGEFIAAGLKNAENPRLISVFAQVSIYPRFSMV